MAVDPDDVTAALDALLGEEPDELVEPRQPDRLVLRHVVQRPLGRPVEGEDPTGGLVAHLDHHVADGEDLVVEVAVGHPELVAVVR